MQIRTLLLFLLCYSLTVCTQPLIMIDPAGDAKHTGRIIGDTFERAITLQCAQELKKQLEPQGITVIITRTAGEVIQPLQSAQFANRLSADLFIHLTCCTSDEPTPSLYCYHFSLGEPFKQTFDNHHFIPADRAHHVSFDRTQRYAQKIITHFQQQCSTFCHAYGPHALPVKALYGIKVPALSIELLLPKKDHWHNFISPLSHAIADAVL
jgi:N-acetylmuramoyl-L-alanine amidase